MATIRSNRGVLIDTELLKIKDALAKAKRPSTVIQRKLIIEEKEGIRPLISDVEELQKVEPVAITTNKKEKA